MTQETIVCDSGPLISLARIQRLELLPGALGAINISEGVYEEVVTSGRGRPGSNVTNQPWLQVHSNPNTLPLESSRLGRGEATTIALALQMAAGLVLVDDRQARIVAERLGLRCAGTLHILRKAKKLGLLDKVQPILEELIQADFRIAKATREAFLFDLEEINPEAY